MANNKRLLVEQESKLNSTIEEREDVEEEPSIEEESESGVPNRMDKEQARRSSYIAELLQSMQKMALSSMNVDGGELLASLAELLQDVQEEEGEPNQAASNPPLQLPWLPNDIVLHILEMMPQVPRIVALNHRVDHVRMGEHNHMEINSTTSWTPQPAILSGNSTMRRIAVAGHGMEFEKAFGYEVTLATIVTLRKKHLWVQFGIDTIYIADRESGLCNIGEFDQTFNPLSFMSLSKD